MKKTIYFLLFAILLFGSCFEDPLKNENIKVFHYNEINPISSLDPAFAKSQNNIWAINQLFNGLVTLDDSLNVIPELAKRWEISEDGKSYVFTLREDVFYHDHVIFNKKRRVVASDFVYSFNRLIDPEVNSPGSWLFSDKITENPFLAPNDSTFIINLNQAFRPMLGILSMKYCSVVCPEIDSFYSGNLRANPIGTGPFKLKRWNENQGLFLIRNNDYFEVNDGLELKLDGVRASFIKDRKTALFELINKNLEYSTGLESSMINELLDSNGNLREDKEAYMQFLKTPFLNTEYLGINMANQPKNSALKNKLVRQALNFAVDRKSMLRNLRNNVGKPANSGFVPRGLPSFDSTSVKGYHFDVDRANELLDQAGYPNGEGLPEITVHTNKDYLDLTNFIARQWQDIGVKVKIEVMESATLREGMRNSSIPLFRASWIADYPDAESFLCMFYSKNPAPPNYTRFSNERFDALYESALVENNDSLRTSLYHEMDRILIEEAPVIFLFYDETANFALDHIKGLSSNALNMLNLKRVYED